MKLKIPFLTAFKKKSKFNLRAPLNRTFIIPNMFGLLFGGIAFVLLLMSMGYANNLLYFYVFFLISIAVTGMWITNKNVDRIQVTQINCDHLFALEEGQLFIGLGVNQKMSRSRLVRFIFPTLDTFQLQVKTIEDLNWPETQPKLVEQIDEGQVRISIRPPRRGKWPAPRIELESTFPFSMLQAWKYGQSKQEILIYPERKGTKELPSISSASDDERRLLDNESHEDNTGLFSHHREFQNNDPVYRIDWKRSAKFDRLFVKKFEESRNHKQVISWGMTARLVGIEERLSQLSLWVYLCEKSGFEYKLLLPVEQTSFSRGEWHFKECMTMLALFGHQDISA